jgi:crotonobetainyl-CoA:carnitine CoA-transferase CaiB-like acyl-CoA transferase
VQSALFESVAFMMGQHMAAGALSGEPVPPMTTRRITWAIYEVFDAADGQVFVGVVSDQQWRRLCEAIPALADLGADPALGTNAQRIGARARILPRLAAVFGTMGVEGVLAACRAARLPCAPVARPEDLFSDPHLLAAGAMADTRLSDTIRAMIPMTPLRFEHAALGLRRDPPRPGEDSAAILAGLGLGDSEIADLAARGIVGLESPASSAATQR